MPIPQYATNPSRTPAVPSSGPDWAYELGISPDVFYSLPIDRQQALRDAFITGLTHEYGGTTPLTAYQQEMLERSDRDYRTNRSDTMFERLYGMAMDARNRRDALAESAASRAAAWARLVQEQAFAREQMEAQMALEREVLAQRRKEMAAGIGEMVAQLVSQNWATGLPWALPEGTRYAPGFEVGGPVDALYGMAGLAYSPTPLAKYNPPSSDRLMGYVADAIGRFM